MQKKKDFLSHNLSFHLASVINTHVHLPLKKVPCRAVYDLDMERLKEVLLVPTHSTRPMCLEASRANCFEVSRRL